jgi:NAD(P)H-dependent FMN reductase
MTTPLLAVCGSNSSSSINRQLMRHAMTLFPQGSIAELDLRQYPLPVFGVDIEGQEAPLAVARSLRAQLAQAKGILFVLAEHNRGMTAFFKNAMDWASRAEKDFKFLAGKPCLLLATSPGRGGGINALETASLTLPMLGANLVGKLSLPSFKESTSPGPEDGLVLNLPDYEKQLREMVNALSSAVNTAS